MKIIAQRLVLGLLLGGIALSACGRAATRTTALPATEVREYQGEKLSSVNDFRENSIAGPQKVALDTYKLEITGLVDKPLSLTYDQVLASPHHSKVITLYCVEAGMPRSCGRAS